MLKTLQQILVCGLVFAAVYALIFFGKVCLAQEVAPAAAVSVLDRILSLADKALDLMDVISAVVLIVALVATVLGHLCFQIAQRLKKKRAANRVGKILSVIEKINEVILSAVQYCPTFFRNPKTKLMIEELQQLKERTNEKS